jgi:hypothetical protein
VIVPLLALALSGPLCHPDRFFRQRINLDGDPAKEEVVAVDSHNCAHTEWLAYVHVRDRCKGAWKVYDFGSRSDVLAQFRVANLDGRTRRPEVFFVTHRIAPVADGAAELVRFDDSRSGCSRPRALFRYVPGPGVQSFDAELEGREIVLTERFEVMQRVTRYRYDRRRDRYVPSP